METGPNPLPYYAGLLVWVIKAIAQYDHRILKTRVGNLNDSHLLLSACMLAWRMGAVSNLSLPQGQLHMDADGSVWIEDHRVADLTGLSQKLLACLFENEGQVVNNRSIITAYGEKNFENEINLEQRVRQEISRLRQEIEPDPAHPRYILTVRGKGYRLNPAGKTK